MNTLEQKDRDLIEKARKIISDRFKENYHHIGAALRTKPGKIFAAVHLEANVGRIAVCAEAIALGMAAAEGDTDIETIVAVNQKGDIVSPCGMCRELISDYSPNANIIINGAEGLEVVLISSLLPNKYRKT
jgi:cytidine deaminase